MVGRAPRALRASIPVLFGYVPLGMAFGLLFTDKLGCPWPYAALSGLVVFAGAAQFLSVGLLAAHAGLAEIFFATLVLNLRHIFYGFSLFHRFSDNPWLRPYQIFSLTDETYSVLTASRPLPTEEDERFCLRVALLNHAYWVLGCALGGALGSGLRLNVSGLDFTLTALFAVLAVEQALTVRDAFPFLVACAAAAAALLIQPSQMLAVSLAIVSCVLVLKSARAQPARG